MTSNKWFQYNLDDRDTGYRLCIRSCMDERDTRYSCTQVNIHMYGKIRNEIFRRVMNNDDGMDIMGIKVNERHGMNFYALSNGKEYYFRINRGPEGNERNIWYIRRNYSEEQIHEENKYLHYINDNNEITKNTVLHDFNETCRVMTNVIRMVEMIFKGGE